MLFVDLDRFKKVNDCLGHARGDQLLVMVANRLRVVVTAELGEATARRGRCSPAWPATSSPCSSRKSSRSPRSRCVARRIALAIAEPFELQGHSIDIGASIGVAVSPDHGLTVESLMRAADIAMYRAKQRGGGRISCSATAWRRSISARSRSRLRSPTRCRAASCGLRMQPQISLSTRRGHRRRGAGALEPSARRHAPAVDLHPDRRADRHHRRNRRLGDQRGRLDARRNGSARARTARLAFNVSPRQLDRADFFTRLRAAFADAARAACR